MSKTSKGQRKEKKEKINIVPFWKTEKRCVHVA
jgi:hypothetical protein